MAAAIVNGRSERQVEQISSSRRSMFPRSVSKSARAVTPLEIHLPELEAAAGFLDEHLNLRLDASQLGRRRAKELDSLLEQLEGLVEADLWLLEGGHDLVEPTEGFF